MSNLTQATLSRTEVKVPADLDLGIKALNMNPGRPTPWVAGAVDLRATNIVLQAFNTNPGRPTPWVAGAVDLRATKIVFTVG